MRIVVIGGGISGLACAWRIDRLGLPVLLLEQDERAGGVIRSERRDDVLFEAGPQSFLLNAAVGDLVREAGLDGEVVFGNSRAPRFVLVGGKLQKAPMSPPGLLFTSLLSWETKKRLFSEPFGRTTPPESEESVAAFVRRKFGAELLDRMVAPMVSGIFAGDAERLSSRAAFPSIHRWEKEHGSIVRGMFKSRGEGSPRGKLAGLRAGNDGLARRLAERLGDKVTVRARALAVRRAAPGAPCAADGPGFEVEADVAGRREIIPARAVVVATPARAAAALLAPLAPGVAALNSIDYAAVAVVGLSYATEHLKTPLNGFGFLAPRSEGVRVLGTVFNSSLFPGRAPADQTLLTSFIGGTTDPAAAALPEAPLFQTVESELRRVLGIFFQPKVRFAQRWPQAIPQYNLGHTERIRAARAALAEVPGIFLTGNYLDGPAIGACVETANRTAEQAANFWRAAHS